MTDINLTAQLVGREPLIALQGRLTYSLLGGNLSHAGCNVRTHAVNSFETQKDMDALIGNVSASRIYHNIATSLVTWHHGYDIDALDYLSPLVIHHYLFSNKFPHSCAWESNKKFVPVFLMTIILRKLIVWQRESKLILSILMPRPCNLLRKIDNSFHICS